MNAINLQEEYAKTEIAKLLNLLDEELVGLAPVKARIREIAALLLIDKLRKNLGITTNSPGLHMSFTGSPLVARQCRLITKSFSFIYLLTRRWSGGVETSFIGARPIRRPVK